MSSASRLSYFWRCFTALCHVLYPIRHLSATASWDARLCQRGGQAISGRAPLVNKARTLRHLCALSLHQCSPCRPSLFLRRSFRRSFEPAFAPPSAHPPAPSTATMLTFATAALVLTGALAQAASTVYLNSIGALGALKRCLTRPDALSRALADDFCLCECAAGSGVCGPSADTELRGAALACYDRGERGLRSE